MFRYRNGNGVTIRTSWFNGGLPILRKLWRRVSTGIQDLHRQYVNIFEDRLSLQPIRNCTMNGHALDLTE